MPRGARIAGWVYFPIHVAVLPLTIGALLMAVLGELPSDVTCNVLYYLIGLVFTLAVMWRFLHRSFDTMAGSILRCVGMMLAAYGIDVLLSLVLQLGTGLIGELPVPNNDAVTGLAKVDCKRMIAVAVLMAPLVEECLSRRGLRHHPAAQPLLGVCRVDRALFALPRLAVRRHVRRSEAAALGAGVCAGVGRAHVLL